jgi:hypothetical protein
MGVGLRIVYLKGQEERSSSSRLQFRDTFGDSQIK